VNTAPDQKAYFEDLAELFHVFAADTDPIYRSWVSAAVPDLSGLPGSRAVDLGCGSGRFLGLLADRHAEVLGVDIASAEIEIARREHIRSSIRLEVRSLLEVTPASHGQFHTVFTVNTIHHLRAHDLVLPHLRSLIAPGGHLVAIDIVNPGGWESGPDWHIHEAFVDAESSYRNRSKDVDVAADVLRLRLHPAWLEHVTTNIPLTRGEFGQQYGEVFPGAEFAELDRVVAALYWQAPGPT
jgi:SAM-dependent methyltransferase